MAGGKQPGVMLYFTLRPGLKALSLEEKGMLLDAIFSYGEDGIEPAFNIDEEAAALARRDLSANRIAASDLGATIEKYAAELTEKAKDSKASSALFNAMLRGQL